MALKGSKETQNIILHTYKYHKQEYECFFDKQIDIDLNDKIRSFVVFVLNYLQDIIGIEQYKLHRENKKRIYNNPAERIQYANEILMNISIDIDKSILKAISMKLMQIILLNDDIYAYTKKELVNRINT